MQLLIEGEFFLERFSGKGGWTFVRLPISQLGNRNYFGMLKVSGKIDSMEFDQKTLMPMGDGCLFLPVSKDIRKKIEKEEGQRVQLVLYRDEVPNDLPEELKDCLLDDPGKLDLFLKLELGDRKKWLELIYSSATEDQKAERIVRLLDFLGR